MLLCCWWCLRPEAVELDSRRVEHHCVLNCEAANSNAIAVVSLDSWENGTTSTTLHPSQRSAVSLTLTPLRAVVGVGLITFAFSIL